MARKPGVNYWPSRKGFGCWIRDEQKILAKGPDDEATNGPVFRAAKAKYEELVFGKRLGFTVQDLIDEFLRILGMKWEPATLKINRERLEEFGTAFGREYATNVSQTRLEEWIYEQKQLKKWASNTERMTLASIKACYRWGRKHNKIDANPMEELALPRSVGRGIEYSLRPHQQVIVVGACGYPQLRDAVQLMRDTGCRPGEVQLLHAKYYHRRMHSFILPADPPPGEKRHKTAKRTGKERVIVVVGESLEIVARLMDRHPTGCLFRSARSPKGKGRGAERGPMSARMLTRAFENLQVKTGISTLVPYSMRHSYAVEWLEAEKPVLHLAELLGTSPKMIRDHYGHLAEQKDYLRNMAVRFAAERGNG